MTLTEFEEEKGPQESPLSMLAIGQILVEVMKQALSQERITLGVFECAELLEACPEQVMLCILPKTTTGDALLSIQHKLIEAHCWENGINLIKVDSVDKMMSLLTASNTPENPVKFERAADFSSVLIGFPTDEMSPEDFQITKHSYLFNETDLDPIPLPD